MNVLGLQGSPRKGNACFLLSEFMCAAEKLGASVATVDVRKKNILPCKECRTCETSGFCPIDDDMTVEVYTLLREADVVVMASPVFFYSVPAQLKALIDRCQVLWARRYRLGLEDPGRRWRKGFLLSLGATRGKRLFDGIRLTAEYFFDGLGARFAGALVYRGIEHLGDMEKQECVAADVEKAVKELLHPFRLRKKILFVSTDNACRSQMAAVFAQRLFGDRLDCLSAGIRPADQVNPAMVSVMEEKGMDMAFRRTRSLDAVLQAGLPDVVVVMGPGETCTPVPGAVRENWNVPDSAGGSLDAMRRVRDHIEQLVIERIGHI